MRILLEANFPAPLVNAIQAALLGHPNGPVAVEKDTPEDDDGSIKDTVVFMINRDKRQIAPAIQVRFYQGYRIFALRQPAGRIYDPYWLTLQVLSLLWKIIDIVDADQEPFVYLLQLNKRQVDKVRLAPENSIFQLKASSKTKRAKRIIPKSNNAPPLFPTP